MLDRIAASIALALCIDRADTRWHALKSLARRTGLALPLYPFSTNEPPALLAAAMVATAARNGGE